MQTRSQLGFHLTVCRLTCRRCIHRAYPSDPSEHHSRSSSKVLGAQHRRRRGHDLWLRRHHSTSWHSTYDTETLCHTNHCKMATRKAQNRRCTQIWHRASIAKGGANRHDRTFCQIPQRYRAHVVRRVPTKISGKAAPQLEIAK